MAETRVKFQYLCKYDCVVSLLQEEHWPLFLSVMVVPTFIQLKLLPWFPESPRYLLIEKHNVHATITGQCCGTAKHQQEEKKERCVLPIVNQSNESNLAKYNDQ